VRGNGASHTLAVVQGKTLYKPLTTNGWGAGLVAGTQFDPVRGNATDVFASIPVTFSYRDDSVLVHANLGWLRTGASGQHVATWGLGTELQAAPASAIFVEAFGQNEGKPSGQVGMRYWLIHDRLQVDATYGKRIGASDSGFFSLGLVLISDTIIPRTSNKD
jgi:hypothetical protein